ncbi:hypothetical protein ACFXJ8_42490 [Nonomuraea sp. NPDC059194]|uniref:hypothetical protein n=1 Tax=Nonomuraea sp. NPDC059194 TaxID=3346764 RepID=UPI003683E84D
MRIKSWAAVAAAVPLLTGTPAQAEAAPKVPPGTTAGYVVFDRVAGKIVAHRQAHRAFRSASVIKILIAVDFLERTAKPTGRDLTTLKVMLRSSDDDAASALWDRGGKGKIVTRMARKLGLADTTPPPAAKPGFWGYTSLSAYDDVARTYRYLMDRADPKVRDLIIGHLRRATPCGTDGFDQYFGIPRGLPKPWAVKQGWSGFGTVPPVRCAPAGAGGAVVVPQSQARLPLVPDLGRPVLHTTGLVGKDDRLIFVLLTAHPAGGGWNDSVRRTTTLARDLYRSLSR